MRITAKVTPLNDSSGNLKAFASITIEECFVVSGFKVMNGKNGLFVSMPNKKNEKEGTWTDTAFPITKDLREEITRKVLEKYVEIIPHLKAEADERMQKIVNADDFPF